MAPDYWDTGARKFGHDEELARERETEEAEERERERERELRARAAFNVEQEQLSKLIASGQARHGDVDAHVRARRASEARGREGGGSL